MSAWERLMDLLSPEQRETLAEPILEAMGQDGWGGVELQIRDHHLHSVIRKHERLFNHPPHKNDVKTLRPSY